LEAMKGQNHEDPLKNLVLVVVQQKGSPGYVVEWFVLKSQEPRMKVIPGKEFLQPAVSLAEQLWELDLPVTFSIVRLI